MAGLTLSQAVERMIIEKRGAGFSEHTLIDYRNTLAKCRLYFESDPPLAALTRDKWVAFFAWLRDEHISEPDGVAPRPAVALSAKTRLNIHTNLSALYTWAAKLGYVSANVIRTIERPTPEAPPIDPLSHDDVSALLRACNFSRTWKTRAGTATRRPTALRDRLIVLLLLDTGVRASELCAITLGDVNLSNHRIRIRHGKGDKPRVVSFGKRTERLLWEYLQPRLPSMRPGDPLLIISNQGGKPLDRYRLGRLLADAGKRAGVLNVHPHRFRHTFATNYLRNGGSMLALQDLLGHSDLEMVRRYAHFVESDISADHANASPVDNWRL